MEKVGLVFSDKKLLDDIYHFGKIKVVPADVVVIAPGDEIVFLPIVQRGVLRIVRQNEEGKEIFLYHLYPGQTCAMSLNCCTGKKKSNIKAITEEETELLLIPANQIEDWYKCPDWKNFIFNTFNTRFAELLDVIDLIAFSNMDKQVLHYLNERVRATGTRALYITHQQIADELHTHREGISRLLRSMEEKNLVKLGRNIIELISP